MNSFKQKRLILFTIILLTAIILVSSIFMMKSVNKEKKIYPNVFAELGKSEEEIDTKINDVWQQMFYGDDGSERIYYPVDEDMGYILDTGSSDVRTEGMSYGMMISVQLDKKEEFDRIWKWAKTYMQHQDGVFKDYFSWHNTTDGKPIDSNPASDGEEYFAMALLFASNRWGDGEGIFNYKAEANRILNAMLHQADDGEGYNMFDSREKQIVFVPWTTGKGYTDPSYHLPAFYELWARWADEDNSLWAEIATTSREFWKKAAHPETGLMANYTTFEGVPYRNGDHYLFSYDAHRVGLNVTLDAIWNERTKWSTEYATRLQSFFYNEGLDHYVARYTVDGKKMDTNHPSGLVATNATASLISEHSERLVFAEKLWNMPIPTGKYRYYDSMLYMFSLLTAGGRYEIIEP